MIKVDLKKLALMGITGGVIFASQGVNAEQVSQNLSLSGNYQQGCGGGKCGGRYMDDSDDGDETPDSSRHGNQNNGKGPSGYNYYRSSNRVVAMNDDEAEEAEDESAENKKIDKNMMKKNEGKPMGYPKFGNPPKVPSQQPADNQAKPVNSTPNSQTSYNRNRGFQQSRMIGMEDSKGGQSCASTSGCGGKAYPAENEDQFVKQLDAEGKQMYNSLSPEGKKLAQRLAKQYTDKNQAVKHAARQMGNPSVNGMDNSNKRQNMMHQ